MTPADPDPQRMLRLKLVFEQALELPPADREAFVRSSVPNDPALRDEVLAMLGHAEAPSAGLAVGAAAASDDDPHEQPTMLDLKSQVDDLGATTVLTRPAAPDGRDQLRDDEILRDVPRVDGYPVLDPYVLTEFVGSGGFGKVYRGFHLVLGNAIAVKCIRKELLKYAEAYPRFEREARLGARLKSRHLVQVLDCNLRSGLLYMVMEWVEGEDLERRVARLGPRPWQETLVLLHGLAAGLAEVHENRVVHRDVKPANVLLGEDGVVKLADLGLARHTLDTKMQMSGKGIGTPAYMAPEQWDSAHECDARADVFSFGATACYLLTGKPPSLRRGADLAVQLDRQCTLPAELRDCIVHCLMEERDDRPADGRALVVAMRQLLDRFELRDELTAVQVKHDRSRRAPPLDEKSRTELRLAWQKQQTTAAEPKPVAPGGEVTGTPPRGATVPMPAPAPRPMLGIAVAAIAVLALGLSIWLLLRDPGTPPEGPGPTPPPPGPDDGPKPPKPGPGGPGPAPTVGPVKPDTAQKPAALEIGWLKVGDEEIALPPSSDPVRVDRPAVRLDTRATVTITVTTNRPLGKTDQGETEQVQIEGAGVQTPQPQGDTTFRAEVSYTDGESDVEITVTGRTKPLTLRLVAPCDPPRREKLELKSADERTGIHYLLRLGDVEPLRFVPVGDLLVSVTEVSNGQFRAFAASGDFERLLADDPRFAEYLASRPMDLSKRKQNWLTNLPRKDPDLPLYDAQIGEMVGFARWASELAGPNEVRLPTTAEWCAIVNRSAGRADNDVGGLPFADGEDPAGLVHCVGEGAPIVQEEPPPAFLGPERVWLRPQGKFGLRHLAGNLRELTVDRYGDGPGQPLGGTLRGGHYSEPLEDARIPEQSGGGSWSQQSRFLTPDKDVGFRLVIRP